MKTCILKYRMIVILILIATPGIMLLKAQNLKTGMGLMDHRVAKGGVVDLEIESYRGTLQWQKSADGTSWMDIEGQTGSKYLLTATSDAYVRAAVKSENCDPVYTGTVHIIIYEQPAVTTAEVLDITSSAASCGGTVTSDGGDPVTSRGICWSMNPEPTIADSVTTNGAGTGAFASQMSGMTGNTTYYVRAYATNNAGTGYGNEISFVTSPAVPVLTTNEVTAIMAATATSGGNITSDGGSPITARGVCWSTSPNPDITGNKTSNGTGTGNFNSSIMLLTPNTTWYVRAYATNSIGTVYGNEISFNKTSGTFTDPRDSKVYKWTTIGTQIWMAENLAYLPSVSPSSVGSITVPYYYVFNYQNTVVVTAKNTSNYSTYGVLYNWEAAKTACPEGWHLPANSAITKLVNYVGSTPGGKLKEAGTQHWESPNFGATNASEFKALGSGIRTINANGWFSDFNKLSRFWTSTTAGSSESYMFGLFYDVAIANNGVTANRADGYSVRCIKD